jgi:hypothetical protein
LLVTLLHVALLIQTAGSLLRDEDRQEIEDLTRETLRVFQSEITDTLKVSHTFILVPIYCVCLVLCGIREGNRLLSRIGSGAFLMR